MLRADGFAPLHPVDDRRAAAAFRVRGAGRLVPGMWGVGRVRVLREAEGGNILPVGPLSSAKRVARELVYRLQGLSAWELELLISGSQEGRNHLLWVAVCRPYRLVAEFAVEVVRERFLSMGTPLELADFDAF